MKATNQTSYLPESETTSQNKTFAKKKYFTINFILNPYPAKVENMVSS